jgi:hypothetical protein
MLQQVSAVNKSGAAITGNNLVEARPDQRRFEIHHVGTVRRGG